MESHYSGENEWKIAVLVNMHDPQKQCRERHKRIDNFIESSKQAEQKVFLFMNIYTGSKTI